MKASGLGRARTAARWSRAAGAALIIVLAAPRARAGALEDAVQGLAASGDDRDDKVVESVRRLAAVRRGSLIAAVATRCGSGKLGEDGDIRGGARPL